MKWLLLQIKIFLLKSGIRKDVAVSMNKESMNESATKNVFQKWLLTEAYLETSWISKMELF